MYCFVYLHVPLNVAIMLFTSLTLNIAQESVDRYLSRCKRDKYRSNEIKDRDENKTIQIRRDSRRSLQIVGSLKSITR